MFGKSIAVCGQGWKNAYIIIGAVVGAIIPLIFDIAAPLIEGGELDGSDIIIDTFTEATVGTVAGTGVGTWIILFSGSIASINYTVKKIVNGEFVDEYDSAEMMVASIL